MKKFIIIILFFIIVPSVAYANPMPPTRFYSSTGNSTLDGLQLPVGTVITAYAPGVDAVDPSDDVLCANFTMTATGLFVFNCQGDDSGTPDIEGGRNGETITFYINGFLASVIGGSAVFASGTIQRVDIEAVSGCSENADCDDENACTTDICDHDHAGADADGCVNTAVDCDDENVCTDDSCDPVAGCQNVNNTDSCDDGDACTTEDTCSGGSCVGGPPPTEICDGVDNDCDGFADEELDQTTCGTGACERTVDNCVGGSPQTCIPGTAAANDATCNGADDDCDGINDEDYVADNSCFGAGVCAAGNIASSCVGGVETACRTGTGSEEICDSLDNDCDGSADEDLGQTTCGLGICVATVDNCIAGVPQICTPGVAGVETCDGLDNDCNGSVDDEVVVDDSNICTDDSCVGGVEEHVNNAAACDDGDACTVGDVCSLGVCTAGTPMDVDDENPCTDDRCIGGVEEHVNNAAACNDGDACTVGDVCNLGGCVAGGPTDVDDGDSCTNDSCVAGETVHTPIPEPATDACHVAGTGICNPTDGTWTFTGTTEPATDACHVAGTGVCDPATGDWTFATVDPPAINACQTLAVSCDPATGWVVSDITCNDGDECTVDSCNPATGCVAGIPVDPDDGNPCTIDSCVDGSAVNIPVVAGISCADENLCNGAETCNGGGVCVAGTPVDPDDSNLCTTDACVDGVAVNTPVADDMPCPDATVCNGDETCRAGECVAGTPIDIPADTSCMSYSCDPMEGLQEAAAANGTACDDGIGCPDACSAGICVAGETPGEVCDDAIDNDCDGLADADDHGDCDDVLVCEGDTPRIEVVCITTVPDGGMDTGICVDTDTGGDAVRTLAGLSNARNLAVDSENNLYLTDDSNRLIRIDSITGAVDVRYTASNLKDFAIDGETVYVTEGDGADAKVVRINPDDSVEEVLAIDYLGIDSFSGALYLLASSGKIQRWTAGGGMEDIIDLTAHFEGLGGVFTTRTPEDLVSHDNKLFLHNNSVPGDIVSVDVADPLAPAVSVITGIARPGAMSIRAEMYIYNDADSNIYRAAYSSIPDLTPEELTLFMLSAGTTGVSPPLNICRVDSCIPTDPADEVCDGADNNCNGEIDEGLLNACGTCGLVPEEVCDGVDNNCNGTTDEGFDADGDGVTTCAPNPDCDDADPLRFPGAEEVCDEGGVDEDCDGLVNEDCVCLGDATNACGSDVGECEQGIQHCVDGAWSAECEDETGPTEEVCDGLDNDCDGNIDEGIPEREITCGDGVCVAEGTMSCVDGEMVEDCMPLTPDDAGEEDDTCDGLDNDCDGEIDEECVVDEPEEEEAPAGQEIGDEGEEFGQRLSGGGGTGCGCDFAGEVKMQKMNFIFLSLIFALLYAFGLVKRRKR